MLDFATVKLIIERVRVQILFEVNIAMFIKATYITDGDITSLSIDELRRDGIKGLILDLDSTIMVSKSGELTQEIKTWLEAAHKAFDGAIIVLSNNKRDDYLGKVQDVIKIRVIGHGKKPFAQGFIKALAVLDLKESEVAVVGDRALTDILGGNINKLRTVLVYPLKSISEPSWKTFFRNLERALVRGPNTSK